METILDLAFQLYRMAQEAPLEDFEALALSILKVLVPFCAAIWFAAEYEWGRRTILRAHLHNAPPEALQLLASPGAPLGKALAAAAEVPRRAHYFHVPELCRDTGASEALELARRHLLERQLLIADIAAPSSPQMCLAIFRPENGPQFNDREVGAAALLMPHMSQALAVNRALHLERGSGESAGAVGGRALVRADGTLLYCSARFAAAIRAACPVWDGVVLPDELLQSAKGDDVVPLAGDECAGVARLGDALLLTLRQITPAERLSPRQLLVAQLFGAGASYKEVARRVTLSPATVRNVVQNTYRKLGINNKAQLARLMVTAK